jgi:hypothetical protein
MKAIDRRYTGTACSGAGIQRIWTEFARDSSLEGAGFEISVPL